MLNTSYRVARMKCWVDMYLFNSVVGGWAYAVSNGTMVSK